ncbi:MAG: hypothetical protein JOY62_12915 [Acidobacteriaceae bacterium]|nr:hypothetical protein [Acidobacteriaceae bacterium]MBV9780862.1 hypothetical protein [Acidobacteriaceae bacterium]
MNRLDLLGKARPALESVFPGDKELCIGKHGTGLRKLACLNLLLDALDLLMPH